MTKDRINRARWSREQKSRASAIFAASLPSVEQERADKLTGLQRQAELMTDMPHMARPLAIVLAEIERLKG